MTEKNEKPTQKRLKDARAKGQVVKSVEITSGIQLLVIFLYFMQLGDLLVAKIIHFLHSSFSHWNRPLTIEATRISVEAVELFFWVMLIFGGALFVATIFATLAQIGPLLAHKALGFKGDRLNPINNLKQLFSLRSVFELLKSVTKISLLSLIVYVFIKHHAASFGFLAFCGSRCAIPMFGYLMSWILLLITLCYILFATFDYFFQHRQIMKQLKMSQEEVKREYKETEGNPETKQRRRAFHHEIQSGSLAAKVKRSTVVIRNPTHLAISLFYHPTEAPVPIVMVKGSAQEASIICKLAERMGIPVVENISLARALYHTDVGAMIADSLFVPVAALLQQILSAAPADNEQ